MLQERYVKLEQGRLRYYKSTTDIKALGMIEIVGCASCTPFDTTPQCVVFEIRSQNRVYLFQAESPQVCINGIHPYDTTQK